RPWLQTPMCSGSHQRAPGSITVSASKSALRRTSSSVRLSGCWSTTLRAAGAILLRMCVPLSGKRRPEWACRCHWLRHAHESAARHSGPWCAAQARATVLRARWPYRALYHAHHCALTLSRQHQNACGHRWWMDGTAQFVGACFLGLHGDLILSTARPRGRRHRDLPIRRDDADLMFVAVHHKHAHRDRVALRHGHEPRGKRVAIDFPLLRGGFIRLPRAFIDVALGKRGGVDLRWRELLCGRRAFVLDDVHKDRVRRCCLLRTDVFSQQRPRQDQDSQQNRSVEVWPSHVSSPWGRIPPHAPSYFTKSQDGCRSGKAIRTINDAVATRAGV